ncbi:UNVERIFIED_CONTAM: hypothetical protein PYX00_005052 [Menopon gallinae]|uniref:Bax inhibitor 1 n=1 Tax=Menopon gallinae TaxID=328185 RepID=A0AAW2HPU4_9NEOP
MSVPINWSSFFNRMPRQLEEPVRQHLKNVYACLTLSVISVAVGAYLQIYTFLSLGVFFSTLAGLVPVFLLLSTPHNGTNTPLRITYLLASGFFIGMGMGPLLQYVINIDPSLIMSALIGTTLIFACFTLSVLFSKRGYWLFLFGPLSSLASVVILLSFGNLFFGSYLIYQMDVYLGLLIMCGLVLFDTTVVIEKFRMGDKDFITHALDLFMNFIGIFKRILIILTERERNERERKRNQ